ncbi:MAG: hypothetical protein ABJC13_25105 [Acidobacteriota bacterium]
MSDPNAPIGPDSSIAPVAPITPDSRPSGLQFDRAELTEAAEGRQAPACAFCRTPLFGSYFDVNGRMACESCRFKIEQQFQKGPGAAGFLRAAGAGFGAAIIGSGIYYAVRALTGYQIGLISILVGYMVGRSVHWGARGRGGWVYQTLAMFLTYMAIVSAYIPLLVSGLKEQMDSKAVFKIFALAAAVPFLAGFGNILGLAIIAFGLWEAWKLNKRPVIAILGPLDFGAAPPSPPAPADI